jgi:hypothetical protein
MLLRRALIRAGFAYHRLLTLSMAYVALPQGANFCANSQTAWYSRSFPGWSGGNARRSSTCLVRHDGNLAVGEAGPARSAPRMGETGQSTAHKNQGGNRPRKGKPRLCRAADWLIFDGENRIRLGQKG